MKNRLSVVYAVYNEALNLKASLQSVADLASEIIVVDGQSQDETVKIARAFGAKIITTTNKLNFHLNKQMAIDAASGELILQLDADEVVDAQLKVFIQSVLEKGPGNIAAWQIRRKNLFFRTFLTKGGQYPDPVIRLFWRGKAYLPAKDVHEQMQVEGKLGTAKGHLLHFANPNLSSYLRKFNTYTSFKAQQLAQSNVPLNFATYCRYLWYLPWKTFMSIFIRHRGYKDGWAGALFAYFSAWHHRVAFFKYLEETRPAINNLPRIYFPPSKIDALQSYRGVGRYSQWLQEALRRRGKVQLVNQAKISDIWHYLFFDLFRPFLKKPGRDQHLLVTVHDLIPLLFPQNYPVGWRGKWHFRRQVRLLKKAALIVADSQATKADLLQKFKLSPQQVRVVYLAANPGLQPPDAAVTKKVSQQYNLPRKYLLYVGDINYNKNIPQLIKALKFLPSDIHLVLLGKAFRPSGIVEWQNIQEQLELSGVRDRVRFLVSVDDNEQLAAIYALAAVYVQPSLYEGFGLPVLEAFRCGTLVVCAANSSLPEVGGKCAWYAASCRGEDLAVKISEVLSLSVSEREKLIKKSQAWEKNFSWDKTAAAMEEIYSQLLSSSC